MVNEIIALDKKENLFRSNTKEILAEINLLSKTIGELFQSGKTSKAKPLKDKSGDLKKSSKDLAADLEDYQRKSVAIYCKFPISLTKMFQQVMK